MTRRSLVASSRCASALLISLLTSGCAWLTGDDAAGDDVGPTECATNADCLDNKVCAANRCAAEGSVGLGGGCSANRDCATGLYCTPAGVCGPAGGGAVGDPCASGGECLPTLVCELYGFGGTCAAPGDGDLGAGCEASDDCIAGLACGAGGTCVPTQDAYPPFAGVVCPPDSTPFKGLFQVPRPGAPISDFYRLPFPNDARVRADGTLNLDDFPRPGPSRLGVDLVDLYADALAEDFDGFSSVANVTFRFSKELDFDTLGANGENLQFVDVTDPTDPATFGVGRNRAFGFDSAAHLYECQHTLQVAPSRSDPLQPGRTYAVYVTSAVRSVGGEAPAPDADLAALLADTQPADETMARAWTAYAGFRAYLAQEGLTAADLAVATVFTVQDTVGRTRAIAQAVEALPVPALSALTLCDGATPSPCAVEGDAQRACGDSSGSFWELHGRVELPNFQQGTLPYDTPDLGGAIAYDDAGAPVSQGTLSVCFALTVPKATMPASGWPLVVHAHGTGGSFTGAVSNGVAEQLAAQPTAMATLTLEGVGHGARRGASPRDPEGLVFNVVNPRAARDNHLQGAADVVAALRVAQVEPFVVGDVAVDLDPTKTYFFGHSQGSNVGIPAIAATDLAPAAVFSGAGSFLAEGIMKKTSPVEAAAALEVLIGESLGVGHPVMTLWQTFFDKIDPVNHDPLLLARPPAGLSSKHVWMSWGQGDTFSPESTLTITAKAMRLELADPAVTPLSGLNPVARPVTANQRGGDAVDRTAACFQYAPDGTYDGHFVSTRNPDAVADWTAFFTSAATDGTPTVP